MKAIATGGSACKLGELPAIRAEHCILRVKLSITLHERCQRGAAWIYYASASPMPEGGLDRTGTSYASSAVT